MLAKMLVTFLVLLFLLPVNMCTAKEDDTLMRIIFKCHSYWEDKDYADACIRDQISNANVYFLLYEPLIVRHGRDRDKIENDVEARIVIYCYQKHFDEQFNVVNFGLVNVCCETMLGSLETNIEQK